MSKTEFRSDADFAREMDEGDALRGYRERFHFPRRDDGSETIYFTGNSLGLMPKTARRYVDEELEDWEKLGVAAHMNAKHPWLPYHEFLTEQMARVIGAKPIETVVMNSLTVNLHLLMVSFFKPSHGRDPREILIELPPREGESILRTEDIVETIDHESDSIAMILLGGVNYYT